MPFLYTTSKEDPISVLAIAAGLLRVGAGMEVNETESTSKPLVAAEASFENKPKAPELAKGNIGADTASFKTSRREKFFMGISQ